ncbi:YheC/YheD family protein [Cohnella suwonensis]|uniref:YheC/YheD family protein n=1 Tax=Cohnella suwonensis TaxID=696072 RepID=A0ABW0LU54_9BACL
MGISIRQNKYKKYKFMKKSRKLRRHLPDTKKMTKKTLMDFLKEYRDIILKPMGGKRGRGVIRVSEVNRDRYEIHYEYMKEIVEENERLYDAVNRYIGNRRYIVQRRIPLATIKGRPFDIRVIVQRISKLHPWKVTGKAVKVAGEGYIVTNIERSKGTVLPFRRAIRKSSLKNASSTVLGSKMNKVAIRAATRLSKLFKEKYIYGFDMGLSSRGRVWIIEANLSPMLSHFKKMDNKRMYRRILRYRRLILK